MVKFKFIDCANEYLKNDELERLDFIRDINDIPYVFCHSTNNGDMYYHHEKITLKKLRCICETKYNLKHDESLNVICCHSFMASNKNKLDMVNFAFITNHIVGAKIFSGINDCISRIVVRETKTNDVLDEILYDVLCDTLKIFKTEHDFLIMLEKIGEPNLKNIVSSSFDNIKYDDLYKFISHEEGYNLYIETKQNILRYMKKVLFHR